MSEPSPLSPVPVDNDIVNTCSDADPRAMSNIDGCPQCVLNTEPPRSAVALDDGWRCAYLCSDCGHAWTTDWRN